MTGTKTLITTPTHYFLFLDKPLTDPPTFCLIRFIWIDFVSNFVINRLIRFFYSPTFTPIFL
ncbi:hypothetical protein HanRHA438_Chr17g0802221 [Helianthus annuus]|nr:hypothetical protein HanRHA438_Chr17g0802221 [Helianthus annuus]